MQGVPLFFLSRALQFRFPPAFVSLISRRLPTQYAKAAALLMGLFVFPFEKCRWHEMGFATARGKWDRSRAVGGGESGGSPGGADEMVAPPPWPYGNPAEIRSDRSIRRRCSQRRFFRPRICICLAHQIISLHQLVRQS